MIQKCKICGLAVDRVKPKNGKNGFVCFECKRKRRVAYSAKRRAVDKGVAKIIKR